MSTTIVRVLRICGPKPFPAWPDLRRDIAAPQPTLVEGEENAREWSELVADMIMGRKPQPL